MIAALRQCVQVTEDTAMSAAAPRLRPARVTVTLEDGRKSTHARESHQGDFNYPYEESALRGKFRELAGCVLTPEGVAQVETEIDRCEQWTNVGDFTALLRRYGKS